MPTKAPLTKMTRLPLRVDSACGAAEISHSPVREVWRMNRRSLAIGLVRAAPISELYGRRRCCMDLAGVGVAEESELHQ